MAADLVPLTIRNAELSDQTGLIDLWVEAWTVARPDIDFQARRQWFGRHLMELRAKKAHIFVANIAHDRVAGFAALDPASGELDQLVVSVWAQQRGIGRILVHHAKTLSPNAIVLSVNQFNASAIRLYEAEGFHKVGEGINTSSGLPTWHMRWTDPAGETAGPMTGTSDQPGLRS